mmetsp:Transcript_25696/g.56286  ORF Transcript_25696/g.56286 Transcript_25696/m.56286 type:complete len:218 (-) Transcript_25696:933-1586(-)
MDHSRRSRAGSMRTHARCDPIGLAPNDITSGGGTMGHQVSSRLLIYILDTEHDLTALAGLSTTTNGNDLDPAIRPFAKTGLTRMTNLGPANLTNVNHTLLLGSAIGESELDEYTKVQYLLYSAAVYLVNFGCCTVIVRSSRTGTLRSRLIIRTWAYICCCTASSAAIPRHPSRQIGLSSPTRFLHRLCRSSSCCRVRRRRRGLAAIVECAIERYGSV